MATPYPYSEYVEPPGGAFPSPPAPSDPMGLAPLRPPPPASSEPGGPPDEVIPTAPRNMLPPTRMVSFDPNVWAAQHGVAIGLDAQGNLVPQDRHGNTIPNAPGFVYPSGSGAPSGRSAIEQAVRQEWLNAGYSPAAVDGITRRIGLESGWNPFALGDYQDGKPTSLSLYQHHSDRAAKLAQLFQKEGVTTADPVKAAVLATRQAISEMNGADPIAARHRDELMHATDPNAAYNLFTSTFERPAAPNLKHWFGGMSPELKARADDLQKTADDLRAAYHSDAESLMRDANAAPAGSKERDAAIDRLRQREHEYMSKYEELSSHPPALKPVDALANFGNAATIIALIGGLFSRHHMTAALGAAGAAMHAINQNNWDQFQYQYKIWDQESKSALELVRLHNDEIRDLISDKKQSYDEKITGLKLKYEALGMQRQADQLSLGVAEKVFQEQAGLERAQQAAAQSKLAFQQSLYANLYAKYVSDGMSETDAQARAGRESGFIPHTTAAAGKPVNVTAVDDQGKTVYSGAATFDSATGQYTPVGQDHPLPKGAKVTVGGEKGAALPPLKTPDNWEGMPDRPPPGLNIDPGIWSAAITYAKSGGTIKPPFSLWGTNPMAVQFNQVLPVAQKALGMTPTQMTDQNVKFAAEKRRATAIESAFGSGIIGRNMVSLNTVADHLEVLRQYADALQNHDLQRENQLLNRIRTELGHPEVNDFKLAATITGDEIVRLLTTTGGTEADRQDVQNRFSAISSPNQLKGAIDTAANYVRARFDPLKQQYAHGDPEREKRFVDEMLTPEARQLYQHGQLPIAGANGGTTVPVPPGAANDPDGTGYRKGNQVWVKRGGVLVLTPGGTETNP